jgi:iron complex outermembrane receptor protein
MRTSPSRRVASVLSLLAAACCVSATTAAAERRGPDDGQSLKQMSLEDLGRIEVTSVSKDAESVRRTPAAIYVITQDDIRRSGATSLPEVLRLAPGLDVARIDTTHWSVGVRGFGDQFSKSVLVLVDGRSVYTPLFAGVFWASQALPLDEIERIEIIRGPGGTIWGANAVNGVINVVTKAASDTQGARASLTAGSVDRGVGTFRYGGRAGTVDYRLYGAGLRADPQAHSDQQRFDTWRVGQAGGRADWANARSALTITGDLYNVRVGQSVGLGVYDPPAQVVHYEPLETSGGNLLARWRRTFGGASHLQIQAYFDRTRLAGPQIGETRNTFDLDAVHHLTVGSRHAVTWGAGARVSPSTVTRVIDTLDVTPHDQTARIVSVFAQDEIAIAADRLTATVGTKLERYTYTGVEVQPSVRLLWTPGIRHSLWTSLARAVRTPSRLERDLQLTGFLGSDPIPTYVRITGNPDFESEELIGFEAGYRTNLTESLYFDVATFRNAHDRLEAFGTSSVLIESTPPPLRAVLAFPYANGVKGSSYGVEVAPTWRPLPSWQVRGFYSYLRIDASNRPGNMDTTAVATYEGSSPRHQVQVQSMLDLRGRLELDATVRRVDSLPARRVQAYTSADVRLGWHMTDSVQAAVSGTNLLSASHAEFGHDPGPTVRIRRGFAINVVWTSR